MEMLEKTLLWHIGQRVRAERQAAGKSQRDLAADVGLQRTSIVNLEAGRQNLTLLSLYRVAQAVNVEVGALLPTAGEIEAQVCGHDRASKRRCARCRTLYCDRCKAWAHPVCALSARGPEMQSGQTKNKA